MAKPQRGKFITVKRPRLVKDGALYFVMKRGGYFRPKAEGYTDNIADAGTWLGSDARKYLSDEGVTLHPVKPLLPVLKMEMRNNARRALNLALLVEQF